MTMTDAIIEKAREVAVLKNDTASRRRDQGVLFAEYVNEKGELKHEAWVISEVAILRWSECALDFPRERPFWSYTTNEFTENTSSIKEVNQLRNLYLEFLGAQKEMFLLPVNAIGTMIDQAFSDDSENLKYIERSRTILRSNPGLVFEKEILLRFRNGRFENPKFDYIWEVHPDSRFIAPFKEGQIYRCNKIGMEKNSLGTVVSIDVRDFYYKDVIEVLVHEVTTGVYMPKSDRDVIDSSNYHPSRVLRYPYQIAPPEGGYRFDPIHIDTTAFFSALRTLEGYSLAEVYVSNNIRPIIIQGANPEFDELPRIEAIIGPLNPEIRGYFK